MTIVFIDNGKKVSYELLYEFDSYLGFLLDEAKKELRGCDEKKKI